MPDGDSYELYYYIKMCIKLLAAWDSAIVKSGQWINVELTYIIRKKSDAYIM